VRIGPVAYAQPSPIRLRDAPVEDHVATLSQPPVASRTGLADMLSQPRRINAVYVEINRAHRVVQPRVVVRVATSARRITNRAITRLIPLRPASDHLTPQIPAGVRQSPAHASSSGRPVSSGASASSPAYAHGSERSSSPAVVASGSSPSNGFTLPPNRQPGT